MENIRNIVKVPILWWDFYFIYMGIQWTVIQNDILNISKLNTIHTEKCTAH